METEVMLTTFDNPFDPFDDFTSWFLFDVEQGYNTCSRLARIAKFSEDFSTYEEKAETERAIDEIIDNDFLCIYKKVTRNVGELEHSEQDESGVLETVETNEIVEEVSKSLEDNEVSETGLTTEN